MRNPARTSRGLVGALMITALTGCLRDETPARLAFKDVSASLPSIPRYGNYGVVWGDFNNDGRIDLIFMGHGDGPLMLAQQPNHSFRDVTKNSGIKDSDWEYVQQRDRHGAACADFNNNGNLDLYITHGAKEGETLGIKFDELLEGRGDFTFTDVTRAAGTMNQQGRARSAVWFDYDGDGWLDLYVLNLDSTNVMYRNNGDGTFTDVTARTGLGVSAVHAAPADFDLDGHVDLLVGWPLRLFRNNGDGTFQPVSKAVFPLRNTYGFGFAWGDVDNDGYPDIFITRLDKESSLLINDGGTFVSVHSDAWSFGEGERSTGVSWGDMDNDGLLDIVNVRSDGYFVYLNEGDLSFSSHRLDAPPPALDRGNHGDAALADFDGDGLLDIASDDLAGYRLFRNRSLPANHWLQIRFEGKRNNRLGLGSKVWITSGDTLLAYREHSGGSGNLRSASCAPVHVGLGQHATVDVRVQWLNGDVTELKNVSANQMLTVTDSP